MINKYLFSSLIIFCIALLLSSCKKENVTDSNQKGELSFTFSFSSKKSTLVSSTDSSYLQGLTSIVYTLEDSHGNVIKNCEKVEIYNMNGNYISKPISLGVGDFKLTQFLVLDYKNNIVYAAPKKGSAKASLVTNPLPLNFSVSKDVVTKLNPEIVSTIDSKPEDFGYLSFNFEIAKTFDFLIGAFIFNSSKQNFELTDATMYIYDGNKVIIDTVQIAPGADVNSNLVDSLEKTTKVTLPEKYNTFIIKIEKNGYQAFCDTFAKEELRLYYGSKDKGPLVVVLNKIPLNIDLNSGLLNFYPFNGDANDYYGTNNGIEYSAQKYVQGVNGLAHDFNGSTDYIKLSKTLNLSNGLSFSLWVYSRGAVSTENNGTIIAKYNMAYPQRQCIQINTFGAKSNNTQNLNRIGVAFFEDGSQYALTESINSNLTSANVSNPSLYTFPNPRTIGLNTWEYVVINVTSTQLQIYLNGELCVTKTRQLSTYFDDATEPTYIGDNLSGGEGSNNHFNGLLDNLRIYSRPLTNDEIQYIYTNKL